MNDESASILPAKYTIAGQADCIKMRREIHATDVCLSRLDDMYLHTLINLNKCMCSVLLSWFVPGSDNGTNSP